MVNIKRSYSLSAYFAERQLVCVQCHGCSKSIVDFISQEKKKCIELYLKSCKKIVVF